MWEKQSGVGWSVVMTGLLVALLVSLNLSFNQWRGLVVTGLLATALMLYHRRLRHFVLLPSCIALVSVLLLFLMKIND